MYFPTKLAAAQAKSHHDFDSQIYITSYSSQLCVPTLGTLIHES